MPSKEQMSMFLSASRISRPRRGRCAMWRWFGFLTIACFGHYCFCLTRLSNSLERLFANSNNITSILDSPTKEATRSNVGLVTCLTDRESVVDALVLAQSIQEEQDYWDTKDFLLEMYHEGTLSRFLQGHLETSFPFVTVVDLSLLQSDDNTCLAKAVNRTMLKHVFTVLPSIQFLQDPKLMLDRLQVNQTQHCESRQQSEVTKFVSHLHNLPLWKQEGQCLVPIPLQPPIQIQHEAPGRTRKVGSIEGTHEAGSWVSFDSSYTKVISFNEFNFTYSNGQNNTQADELLHRHWQRHSEARRLVQMDRPMEWVAFDTGFHADDSSTLNTLSAANRSLLKGSKIINIDIALSRDRQLVAVHNDKSITPADFQESRLTTSIFQMDASQALQITNPCLPAHIVRQSLLPNPYQPYQCKPEPVVLASEFIELVKAHDKQHPRREATTELIFDLKAPSVALQVEQARILAQTAVPSLHERQVAVRFFSVFEEDRLAATVFPEEALQALASDPTLEGIAYYVNVPSSFACLQIAAWIQNQASFANKMIQGCYVIQDHKNIAKSWREFTIKHNVNTSSIPSDLSVPPKRICDVPRKQTFREPDLWAKEYNHCLIEGFDYVHDPFPPPKQVYTDRLSLLSSVRGFGPTVGRITQRHLRWIQKKGTKKKGQVLHFGYGSASDWSEEQFQWYQGLNPIRATNPETELMLPQRNFRCVSKTLSVLLFLKFQEMGYLNIDDLVVDGSNHTYPMTYRQIFANTGGFNGTRIGEDFVYGNNLWYPIPSSFERQTGLRFVDAMNHYILEPMGLNGFFDETNVTIPPYAGRGYNGHPEDLITIAGTLAAGGVSPKTRKQIVSPSSIETMLADSITSPALAASFAKDYIVKEMTKVYNRTGDFPTGFVHGYGMGLWRVNGWRKTAQGLPIQGWLAQGSCMVYFDTTGLIFSFFPKGGFTASLVRSYGNMIRDIGDSLIGRQEHSPQMLPAMQMAMQHQKPLLPSRKKII